MQNIITLGQINDALKFSTVTAAQLAEMGFAALANKPICEALPQEEARRLRTAKLYPAESIGQIRVALGKRLAAPASCLHQIQEPAPVLAAPAAVAVPDELIRAAKQALACMDGLQQHLGRAVCQVEADALRAALAATQAAMNLSDAYVGAREDLSIWKRRALEAERDLRAERQTTSLLVAEINAMNGPAHFGEAAVPESCRLPWRLNS